MNQCVYVRVSQSRVTAAVLDEYRTAVFKVYDKNSDGRLSRDELALLLSTT